MLFAIAGMMLMATASDLLVIFLALEVLSLAVYVLTGIRRDSAARHRGGAEVFSARRVFERVLSLRHRVHLRRDGQHAARSRRQPDCRAGAGADADAVAGARACCSSGSPSRCLPSRFTCGRRTRTKAAPPAVTGFMSTGVKAAAFAAFARVFLSAFEPLKAAVGAGAVGRRRGDDDCRDGGGGGAVERQADARVLEHRPRRVSARGAARRERYRQGRRALLSAGLRRHQSRRLRRDRACSTTPIARTIACATTRGSGNDHPVLAALMTIFLLSLGGFPPLGRLHREVVRLQRRGQGRLYLAGHHRRADERRRRLLLPAHCRHDVHDAERSAGAVSRGAADRRLRPGGFRRSRVLSRHPADARPRTGRPRRFPRSSNRLKRLRLRAQSSKYSAAASISASLKMATPAAAQARRRERPARRRGGR